MNGIANVLKRDGKFVSFDKNKIISAISKAGFVDDIVKNKIALEIESAAKKFSYIGVEMIQDFVEKKLMSSAYKDVAREYIRYRYKRELLREHSKMQKNILEIVEAKNEYVNGENSNKNPQILSTQRDYMAGEVSKDITMRLLLPDDVVKAHKEGIIHYHDSDYFIQTMHNCCLVNLEDMLQNGTVISKTLIEKPHSFHTACNVATQIMAQVASNQYGGQSVSLSHLAPFVDISRRKILQQVQSEMRWSGHGDVDQSTLKTIVERRVREEVKNGVQTIQYQVNTLMTTNGQTPFVTVFLYLNEVPEGQLREDLAMIIEEVLLQRYQGVKNEKGVWITPAFPKLIYVLSENNVKEGSKYFYLTELAAKCTAKRLVPDYVSEKKCWEYKSPYEQLLSVAERRDKWGSEKIWGKNPFESLSDEECKILDKYVRVYRENSEIPEDVSDVLLNHNIPINVVVVPLAYSPMGCRSFLTPDYIHYKTYGRFNQGVVTINLPDVSLSALQQAKENGTEKFEEFWSIFEDRLELCHRALKCRHERLKGTITDVSPLHWQHGALARFEKGEVIDPLLFDNYSTLSLGYAGLYECVRAITGKSHTDDSVKEFALNIMRKMNEKCTEWRSEENISYSLYGTPIESTTEKFARALKKRFGTIDGENSYDYITNSYHVNVREKIDPFTKLKFESEFQELSPGGAISYIETGHLDNNIPAVLEVIKYIYDNILYAELNTKSDYCQVCGYNGDIQVVEKNGKLIWKCPNCGNEDSNKMNVARRTCGYIGTNFWAQGRTAEIKDRYVHLGGNGIDS